MSKTTKTALDTTVTSFLNRYESLTGGTREETLNRSLTGGMAGLDALATTIAAMAANPNKACAGDHELMRYALVVVPEKLEFYRSTYFSAAVAAAPAPVIADNIVFHNFRAA